MMLSHRHVGVLTLLYPVHLKECCCTHLYITLYCVWCIVYTVHVRHSERILALGNMYDSGEGLIRLRTLLSCRHC